MAADNLRIIYQNLIDLDTTTITASSSQSVNTSVSNLKLDTKSLVWRSSPTTVSGTTVKAILVIDFGTTQKIGGVILAFSNLNSSSATIKVTGYNNPPAIPSTNGPTDLINYPTISGTAAYTTGTVLACPWNSLDLSNWGTNPINSSTYSYGGGTYARAWVSLADNNARFVSIEITDYYSDAATGRYIEVSRLIVGPYWSPVYNTGYGMTAGIKDLSEHSRTESGDLVTNRGVRFQTLSFDLNWLTQQDRVEMTRILLGNGMPKPLLVSLFPTSSGDSSDYERERAHQIYGKLVSIPGISHTILNIYSTNLELEEV